MSQSSRLGLLLTAAVSVIVAGGVLLGLAPQDAFARDGVWLVLACLGGALVAGGIALVGVYAAVRIVRPVD